MHGQLPTFKRLSKNVWRLMEPFRYRTDGGCVIEVPAGFTTDGASSPFHQLIEPLGGHYGTAVLVHDYLYVQRNEGKPHPCAKARKRADAIFLEAMRRAKVRPLVRLGMWAVVRLFGMEALKKPFVRG